MLNSKQFQDFQDKAMNDTLIHDLADSVGTQLLDYIKSNMSEINADDIRVLGSLLEEGFKCELGLSFVRKYLDYAEELEHQMKD